jgi:hypothetical protein
MRENEGTAMDSKTIATTRVTSISSSVKPRDRRTAFVVLKKKERLEPGVLLRAFIAKV